MYILTMKEFNFKIVASNSLTKDLLNKKIFIDRFSFSGSEKKDVLIDDSPYVIEIKSIDLINGDIILNCFVGSDELGVGRVLLKYIL